MLWLRPRAALSRNGSHVSNFPAAMSSRWTAAKPLLFVHTLPSTREWSGLVMLTCVMSLFTSGGRLQVENVAVLRSNFAMPLEHHPEPEVAIAVEADGQGARRKARLQLGHAVLRDAPRSWIELAQRLLAEVAVPGDAVVSDDDVVVLDRRPPQ